MKLIYLLQLQGDLGLFEDLSEVDKFQIVALGITDKPYKQIEFTDNHSLVIGFFNQISRNSIILSDTFILNTNIHNLIKNG